LESADFKHQLNQQKTNAGSEYFSTLYQKNNHDGSLRQSRIDKYRDKMLVRRYQKYSDTPIEYSNVLDVGCGYGWLLEKFSTARKLVGVDISNHAVEIAQERNPEMMFHQGNVEKSIDVDDLFDLVLAINVIEHLTEPKSAAESISKVCKLGGLAIVHLPTISNALTKWEYGKLYESDPTHIYRPSGKQVREIFEASGFVTLTDSYLPHFPAAITKLYPMHPAYLAVFRKV
jgi:2-polyprenyl-3-methyl-5-hydroxy-6-metoxy-1,4-benzoquinol methylase